MKKSINIVFNKGVNMKIKLNDVGSINNAEIDISKINVVGGVNSSGKSIVSKLLYCYLKSENDDESLEFLMDSEGLSNLKNSNITFKSDLDISEVFYIDNISILDLKNLDILRVDHIIHIKEALENEDYSSRPSRIQEILKYDCANLTAAGIKQIGIIEILLQNNSLKENSFLIIDEPESNLHPEWQIKFAQILTILSKEMGIYIYLNSHSPIFIEAVSLYAQYYDLLDETSFYLTQKQDNGKYDFRKINPKNMGDVYEDLTNPYDELDKIKAEIIFKG